MAEKSINNAERPKGRRHRKSEIKLALFLFQASYMGNYQDLQDVLSSDKIKNEKKWLVLNARAADGMPILTTCIKGSAQTDDEKDHLECIKALLSTGIPSDAKDANDRTVIHWAVLLDKIEICRYLLQHGAVIEASKTPPLHIAVSKRSVPFVKLLCEYKTENMLEEKDDLGRSPLCHALLIDNSLNIFNELLVAGCDVNGTMANGTKSLAAHVIENDMVEFLEIMLKYGLNLFPYGAGSFSFIHLAAIQKSPRTLQVLAQQSSTTAMEVVCQSGKTPLMYAVENEMLMNVKVLIDKQVNLRKVDSAGNTALHFTSRNTSSDIVDLLVAKDKELLNICNKCKRYSITNAVLANNQVVVRALLDHGPETSIKDNEGHTLIHYAAEFSSSACLSDLASVGLSLNVADNHGICPIHYAVRLDSGDTNNVNSKVDFLKKLVATGVDLNVADDRGLQPIHWAVCMGFTEALKILLIEDANVNAKTGDEEYTALHLSCNHSQYECLQLLLCQPTINIDQPDNQGKTALFTACNLKDPRFTDALLNAGANPDHQDKEGKTPAHIAATNATVDCLWLLLAKRANFEIKNNNKETPIHLACNNPDDACVRFLLTRRCNVNATQKHGYSALHIAVSNKYSNKVNLLLQNGAKWNQIYHRDKDSLTPLDIALNNGDHKCIKLLQKYGARTAHYILTQSANTIRTAWKKYRKRKVARGEALPLANTSSIYTSSNASESVSMKGQSKEDNLIKQESRNDSSEVLTLQGRSVTSANGEGTNVVVGHGLKEHCQGCIEIPGYMMEILTEKSRRDFTEVLNRSDREIMLMRDLMKETEQLLVRAKRVNEEAESLANSNSFRRIKIANKEYMEEKRRNNQFSIVKPNLLNSLLEESLDDER